MEPEKSARLVDRLIALVELAQEMLAGNESLCPPRAALLVALAKDEHIVRCAEQRARWPWALPPASKITLQYALNAFMEGPHGDGWKQ